MSKEVGAGGRFDIFLDSAYHKLSCSIFFKLSFGYVFKLFFALFVAANKENSEHSQISRSLINFPGKMLNFKELQAPLKWHFKFQHFSRSSRTSTSPVKTNWKMYTLK